MPKQVRITTSTRALARAMNPYGGLEAYNEGCYLGTKIRIRQLTGDELVTVEGSSSGARIVEADSWIADRFGPLGARQVKRLLQIPACMCGTVDPPRPISDDGNPRCIVCGCY